MGTFRMTDINIDLLTAELRRDEGVRKSAYQDSEGYWTIGVGRCIDARLKDGLSDDEINYLLKNDISRCINDIALEPWFLACDTDNRRRALLNMRFELGADGLREFTHSLALIAAANWAGAADHLQESLWAHQVPERASRVIDLIRNG